jgi:DNA polymerase-3 subunit epsilon
VGVNRATFRHVGCAVWRIHTQSHGVPGRIRTCDRRFTNDEVTALAEFAGTWGIDRDDAAELHDSYMDALVRRAWADDMMTDAEERDLEALAELLGVPREEPAARHLVQAANSTLASDMIAGERPINELAGRSVCFTSESVCILGSARLSREDQESLATWAGLTVKAGVSGRLDLLVLADPGSRSGKARKATELGVRQVAEPVFWRLANVPID